MKLNLYPLLPAKIVEYDVQRKKYIIQLYDFEQMSENRWIVPANTMKLLNLEEIQVNINNFKLKRRAEYAKKYL